MADERANGGQERRDRWNRYDLKTCGHVSAGLREEGALVRLSSEAAQKHWRTVVLRAANVSRLDLQVTVRPDPPDPKLGAAVLRSALRWVKGREHAPKVAFHGGPAGIETVYLGSRSSETFGRVYSKEAESGDDAWRDCWRYEVETKGDLAVRVARLLAHDDHAARSIELFVFDHFNNRGIRPRFERPNGDVRVAISRAKSDDETRLKWLRESVAPVVSRLSDNGHGDEACAALGVGGREWKPSPPDKWGREV